MEINLQCYSEDTIIQQGSYSLKVVAAQTDSLNDTLTKSGLSIDLTDKDEIKVGVYASRTGTNIQLQLINTEPSWDLLDEDCSDISDWVDGDSGTGVSEVDPAGQFRFDSNNLEHSASRNRDIGSYPTTITFEIKLYHDALGTIANAGYFEVEFFMGSEETFGVRFAKDGIFINDTDSGWTEVGTDLVKYNGSAEWQIWRFTIDRSVGVGDGVCDVYLDDSTHNWEKVGSAIPCSRELSGTDGVTYLTQYGYYVSDRITHMDYVKIATGLHLPMITKDIVISSAGVWETKTWDISEIENANKDNIEQIIIKIINADADNIFYVDNLYAQEVALDNAVLFGANF